MSVEEKRFKRYLAIETAGGPAWHPSSRKIVFVYDAPGLYQIYSTEIDEGRSIWPDRLTYEMDRCTEARYLPDGSIIFSKDNGGDENFQIGHISTKGKLSWITEDLGAKHRITHIDDTGLYYIANIQEKGRLDLYRQQYPVCEQPQELLFEPETGICAISAISKSGSKALVQQIEGNAKQNICIYDFKNHDVSCITDSMNERDTRWQPIKFIDESHYLVNTDHKSNFKRLAVLSSEGDFFTFEEIESNLEYTYEAVSTVKDSDEVYYALNVDGYNRINRATFKGEMIDEISNIRLPLKGVIRSGDQRSWSKGMSVSPDGRMLAVTLSSATEPSNVWIINTDTMNTWKATNSQMSGIPSNRMSKAELKRFESFDRLIVPYFKYLPNGDAPKNGWPAIFMIHGGPEAQMRPEFNPVIQFYVSAGYAVVTPNIRGSLGYGKRYLDLDNVEKRLDSIHDIERLFFYVKENEEQIDHSRIVIYGGSYGGFAVLSAITEYPDLWKAAIDIVGISNFETFLENTASWRRENRESEYGSLEHHREILRKISPIHKVDRIQCPLFIIQGDNDERVPLSESIQIFERVKEKGIPVELLRFSDEGHGLSKLPNRIRAYSRVLEWLKEIV